MVVVVVMVVVVAMAVSTCVESSRRASGSR